MHIEQARFDRVFDVLQETGDISYGGGWQAERTLRGERVEDRA